MVGVFAAIDANGWVMIIGAVTLAIIQVLAAWRNNVKTDTLDERFAFIQESLVKLMVKSEA